MFLLNVAYFSTGFCTRTSDIHLYGRRERPGRTERILFPLSVRLVDLIRMDGVEYIFRATTFETKHGHELLNFTDRINWRRNHVFLWYKQNENNADYSWRLSQPP